MVESGDADAWTCRGTCEHRVHGPVPGSRRKGGGGELVRAGKVQEKAPSRRVAMESTAPARWSRSDSVPSSMICCGVRPAKAGLGAWHHAARFRPRVCRTKCL